MRCQACDQELTDDEAIKKDSHNQYYDMCVSCIKVSNEEYYENFKDESTI